MKRVFRDLLSVSTYLLGVNLFIYPTTRALAATSTETESSLTEIPLAIAHSDTIVSPDTPMAQVTSISQLSDVKPTDWAFQALYSLVERYGIILNYPDNTFRGNRALTRYEFAAGLNTALNRLNELIKQGNGNLVNQADLLTLQKLQTEFATELSTFTNRVDALEVSTKRLESYQFSSTTRLRGEVIFGLSDAFGDVGNNNTVFQQRARLYFESSFTGKDRLRTRIDFGNFELFNLPTNEGNLGFESNTEGTFELGDLEYRFPIGERLTVFLEGNDAGVHDFTDVINPFFADSGTGAISRFGRRNPIYRIPNASAGLGASLKLNDALSFDFGYLAGETNNSGASAGLFSGDYGAIGQLTFTSGSRFALGLTYINSYAGTGEGLDTETGSTAARLDKIGPQKIERPVVANSYGIAVNYSISDKFAIGGWAGYTAARVIGLGDAQVWNYALTLAFPDLGKQGNLGGILVGMQPKLTGTSKGLRSVGQYADPDTSLHIEGFYRYQVMDSISITPGIIWLTAPNHNRNNDSIFIGTIRTTLEF